MTDTDKLRALDLGDPWNVSTLCTALPGLLDDTDRLDALIANEWSVKGAGCFFVVNKWGRSITGYYDTAREAIDAARKNPDA